MSDVKYVKATIGGDEFVVGVLLSPRLSPGVEVFERDPFFIERTDWHGGRE